MRTLPESTAVTNGTLPIVNVYTDGGCDPNPGPGGWAAIIEWPDYEWVLSGSDPETTNNRMELQAPAAALALLDRLIGRCRVLLYSDSEYLQRGMTEWLTSWLSRGWRTTDGRPVRNQDLWWRLHELTQAHAVTWHWLRGHAGHTQQERADRLVGEARRSLRRRSKSGAAVSPATSAAANWPAVEISVKAACRGARTPGGWGAVVRSAGQVRELSGGQSAATANAMLIRGASEALRTLKQPSRVTMHSDADYLIKGGSTWAPGWAEHGWRTREGKPVSNRAEWEALLDAVAPHTVNWVAARAETLSEDLILAGQLAARAASAKADGRRQ